MKSGKRIIINNFTYTTKKTIISFNVYKEKNFKLVIKKI